MAGSRQSVELVKRAGLPEDLRWLVQKYPREIWSNHANLGDMARFWLQRHDMFRELGQALHGAIGDYREERLEPQDFARWFAPRLRFFLQQLHGHHQIEDMHYFPIFAAAEKRLKSGFDILDSDHHAIHDALEQNSEAGRALLMALDGDRDRQRYAADAFTSQNARLLTMLERHLGDEEDLIIPLILDRSEATLGIEP